jgi:hypothetical protein
MLTDIVSAGHGLAPLLLRSLNGSPRALFLRGPA